MRAATRDRRFDMGQSLDQILGQIGNGDSVGVTIASNQDNGIASYAVGSLTFQKGDLAHNVPSFLVSGQPFAMFFSDRLLNIDPPPAPGTFGNSPRQPFNANETEKLGVSIRLDTQVMQLSVFGTQSPVKLSPMGDLLVGLGPSLGRSAAGVFIVSFTGFSRQPH
jgi:hypothetical protein